MELMENQFHHLFYSYIPSTAIQSSSRLVALLARTVIALFRPPIAASQFVPSSIHPSLDDRGKQTTEEEDSSSCLPF